MLTTTVHLSVLNGTQSVDGLILVEQECLAHLRHIMTLFAQQHLSFGSKERQTACLGILSYRQFSTRLLISFLRYLHVFLLGRHHKGLGGLSFNHMDNPGCYKLNLHLLRPACKTRHDQQQGQYILLHHSNSIKY